MPESLKGIFWDFQVVKLLNDKGQQKRDLDQEAINGFNRLIVGLWDEGMKQERLDHIYREVSDSCYQEDYLQRRGVKNTSDQQQDILKIPTDEEAKKKRKR